MDASCLVRPRNVVGTIGFLLVTAGLLGTVAASLVLFSFLSEMQKLHDPSVPPTSAEIDDDWLPTIVAIRCGFGVIVVGTIASLVGLRWRPRKLAIWGAAIGLMPVSAVLIMLWWSSTG